MSRFFKSAAFPILIVIVLAFFAQKLIGSTSHSPKETFGNLLTQLQSRQVESLSLDQKDNSAQVTLTPAAGGVKYSVGYPDSYAPQLINLAKDNVQPNNLDIQSKSSNGWRGCDPPILPASAPTAPATASTARSSAWTGISPASPTCWRAHASRRGHH